MKMLAFPLLRNAAIALILLFFSISLYVETHSTSRPFLAAVRSASGPHYSPWSLQRQNAEKTALIHQKLGMRKGNSGSCTSYEVGNHIQIKDFAGRKLCLEDLKPTATVRDVKALISAEKGIPLEDQKLIFRGKVLKNDSTFPKAKGGNDDSQVTLLLNLRGGMNLKVKTMSGNTLVIEGVDLSDTIEKLKIKVAEKEGMPVEEQRLIAGGKQLEDHRLVSDYGLSEDSVLHLVLRLRGGNATVSNYAVRLRLSAKSQANF